MGYAVHYESKQIGLLSTAQFGEFVRASNRLLDDGVESRESVDRVRAPRFETYVAIRRLLIRLSFLLLRGNFGT